MARYWLKRQLKCFKNVSCGKCSKWKKCLELFVKKAHDLVSSNEDVPKTDPTQRANLRFTEEKRTKPSKGLKGRRKKSRVKGLANTVFIVRKTSRQ